MRSLFKLLFISSSFFCCSSISVIAQEIMGVWSGTIHQVETLDGKNFKRVTTSIINIRENELTGNLTEFGEWKLNGKLICKSECSGQGLGEIRDLSLNINEGHYSIEVKGPKYNCSNQGTYCETPTSEGDDFSILIRGQLGKDASVLAGSDSSESDILGELGKIKMTRTWSLKRTSGVELIVIPTDYHNWLPEPGKDEFTKGKVMNLNLKLQQPGGKPATIKARSFELGLNDTSQEPGITINAPLVLGPDLPDLRFQLQPNASIDNNFQTMKINCNGCTSASANINCYDGGAWTTLTVTATLEDGSVITGRLLSSVGVEEIPIPKRAPGTHIGQAWLIANGDPVETDDKETSKGNQHDGDGLSAYEEYRGVISEGVFTRLSPKKKELGVQMKRGELAFFSNGIRLFESETELDIIKFYENEIDNSRRLNKNKNTAHVYDQFVLKLEKGKATIEDAIGECRPINISPKIPEQTTAVIVDIDKIFAYEAFNKRNGIPTLNTALEEIEVTTAHEIGHGVSITHHGRGVKYKTLKVLSPSVIVLNKNGDRILDRPYPLPGLVGKAGSEESGNLSCFMAYTEYYSWALNERNNNTVVAEVPALPLGKKICTDANGTDINARPNYFYGADDGDCLGKIQLKR